MSNVSLGVIVNGATSRLARHQHLPALLAIRREGGLLLSNGRRVIPEPILVGRNAVALRELADVTGIKRWSTNLDTVLAGNDDVFFDVAATGQRFQSVARAIGAGKHVYCEKPIATSLIEAMQLVSLATAAGIRHGTVQDKIFLPGFRKLLMLRKSGFFGRILEARLEFGRWIFDGEHQPVQRPSWNYRKADGGGLLLDMFPHWRYMIDHLIGKVMSVSCTCRTHIGQRRDEAGVPYEVDVEDSAFAQIEVEGNVLVSVNSSWCTRIRRDDVIVLQVDGTAGSAVATPHECYTQADVNTPTPVITIDTPQTHDFFAQWLSVPDNEKARNSYRAGWERFIRHVAEGAEFPFTLLEGARGVQLAELAHRSDTERRWIEVPDLERPA